MKNDELKLKTETFRENVKFKNIDIEYKDDKLLYCRNKELTELEVREGTKIICDHAFYDNKTIEKIILPASIKNIGESAFAGCINLKSINIPEGVTELKASTFRDCKSLQTIELPSTCTKIDKWVFSEALETLVCHAPSLQIDKNTFLNHKRLNTVLIPKGCIMAYARSFHYCGLMPSFEELKSSTEKESDSRDDLKFIYLDLGNC